MSSGDEACCRHSATTCGLSRNPASAVAQVAERLILAVPTSAERQPGLFRKRIPRPCLHPDLPPDEKRAVGDRRDGGALLGDLARPAIESLVAERSCWTLLHGLDDRVCICCIDVDPRAPFGIEHLGKSAQADSCMNTAFRVPQHPDRFGFVRPSGHVTLLAVAGQIMPGQRSWSNWAG